ncbi:MAG: hypothetical protein ACOVP4_11180 [Bacteriovoracaceae bacterium]
MKKFYLLFLVFLGCSSHKSQKEGPLLEREQIFLTSLVQREKLIPSHYRFTEENKSEHDAVLKGLIHYYPFADVKLVTEKMKVAKIQPSASEIEKYMKEENDSIVDQMTKLVTAFRLIPKEQLSQTQESMDRFGLQIRRRMENYKAPKKCFNKIDCSSNQICLEAGFCAIH